MTSDDAKKPEPWERQKGESQKAFAAFNTFLNLDPAVRTIRLAAQEHGLSYAMMAEWSSRWKWTPRVGAWDDHCAAVERDAAKESRAERRRRMDDAQEELARGIRLAAFAKVEAHLARLAGPDAEAALAEITVVEAARLAEVGVKIERLALGDVTSRQEVRGVGEFVQSLCRIALKHLPVESREAFLIEVESASGWGALSGGEEGDDDG